MSMSSSVPGRFASIASSSAARTRPAARRRAGRARARRRLGRDAAGRCLRRPPPPRRRAARGGAEAELPLEQRAHARQLRVVAAHAEHVQARPERTRSPAGATTARLLAATSRTTVLPSSSSTRRRPSAGSRVAIGRSARISTTGSSARAARPAGRSAASTASSDLRPAQRPTGPARSRRRQRQPALVVNEHEGRQACSRPSNVFIEHAFLGASAGTTVDCREMCANSSARLSDARALRAAAYSAPSAAHQRAEVCRTVSRRRARRWNGRSRPAGGGLPFAVPAADRRSARFLGGPGYIRQAGARRTDPAAPLVVERRARSPPPIALRFEESCRNAHEQQQDDRADDRRQSIPPRSKTRSIVTDPSPHGEDQVAERCYPARAKHERERHDFGPARATPHLSGTNMRPNE